MKAGLVLLLGFLFTINAFAQGTVNFANTSGTRMTTNNLGIVFPYFQSGFTTGTDQFTVGLYIAPAGTTDPNAFTLMGPTTFNQSGGPGGLLNGRFDGNPAGAGSFVISNNTGQPIAFQVRVWSTFFGPTHQDALTWGGPLGWLGSSAIGEVTPATSGTGPSLFGTGAGQVGGIGLTPWPVPEPSNTALLLLGAAGLGLWRFRCRQR